MNTRVNINVNNPCGYRNNEEILGVMELITGNVKLITAGANNCLYIELFNAYDAVRKHPLFRQRVKRAFNDAIDAYWRYERALKTTEDFNTALFTEDSRKKYGNLSCEEYFFMWQDIGQAIYRRIQPDLDALRHKFCLALEKDGSPYPDIECRLFSTSTMFQLAHLAYKNIDNIILAFGLAKHLFQGRYAMYDLSGVWRKWSEAVHELGKATGKRDVRDFTELEQSNFRISYESIGKVLFDIDELNDSVLDALRNNEDCFRTKGEYRKEIQRVMEHNQKMREEERHRKISQQIKQEVEHENGILL